jgi:hypothetical protein
VLEVEGENRQFVALGEGHHGGVGEAEVQVREAGVDLDGASQKPGGQEGDVVLARRQGGEEEPCDMWCDACAKEVVGLRDNGQRNHELTTEPGDELRGDPVSFVALVGGREERAGIGDDPQDALTGSARYRSAARPRSAGPSPAAT